MTKRRYSITARTYNHRNQLLSTGTNSYIRTHPIQKHFATLVGEPARIYLHAEISALLRAGDRKVHTLTIQSDGASAPYPCKICQKAIEHFGVKRVVILQSNRS